MDAGIHVRRARREDHARLVEFNLSLARETEAKELDHGRLERGVREALLDEQRGTYWVAESQQRVAASLLITREWSDWRAGWIWWIQSVYVEPQARRHGLYRALHEHVLRTARAAGDVVGVRLYVDRANRTAQATYRSLGMHLSHYDLYESDQLGEG